MRDLLPLLPAIWLGGVNLAALILFGVDKRRARLGVWRIPERTLFLAAILGGSPGAIAGMFLFHHKTRHRSFRWGLPAILILQVAAGLWLWWYRAGQPAP